MPEINPSAASHAAHAFFPRPSDGLQGDRANAQHLQGLLEATARYVEAASTGAFDAAKKTAIDTLAPSILRQPTIQGDAALREKIGMCWAELLKDARPDAAQPPAKPGFHPPFDLLADLVGPLGIKALKCDIWPPPPPAPDACMVEHWRKHVLDQLSEDGALKLSWDPTHCEPPRNLLRAAQAYLKKHPEETPETFFKPIRDLVENEIAIPPGLARALDCELIPFHMFRTWVSSSVEKIERLREARDQAYARGRWNGPAYRALSWQHSYMKEHFAAAFSPLALELLGAGKLTPDRLGQWVRLDTGSADGNALPVKETSLVGKYLLHEEIAHAVPNAGELHDPEILVKLANAGVPASYVASLLSVGNVVAWPEIQAEADRMVERYKAANLHPSYTLDRHANIRIGKLDSPELKPRLDAVLEETKSRLNPLRDQAEARMASYERLARLAPLAHAWMVSGPADGPLLWSSLPFKARVERWDAAGLSVDQQYAAGRFLVNGLDEAGARAIVQANAAYPERLQAWQGWDAGMDLRPWLDEAMKQAVQRWLTDPDLPAEVLALLPGMIRCDLSLDQIDGLIHSSASIARLDAVFGPQAQTPARIGAGLLTAAALYEQVNDGDIDEEKLQEEAHQAEETSRLRQAASRARDQLRARLHVMESIRAQIPPDAPEARQCDGWIQAWRGASDGLREFLQSPLEDRLRDNPAEVEAELSKVFSTLAFTSVASPDPNKMGTPALRA